jgi:iron complex outermembrane receptor protein
VDYFDPFQPLYVNQNALQSESVGGELQVSKTFWEKHRLTVGGDMRSDFRLSQTSRNLDPPATILDSQHTAEVLAAYIQDEYQVFESLIINAGVRYDHFSTFGDTVNPRTALIYSPWKPTSFKFLYGQAFRAPNVYEFYGSVIGKSNPELSPETIDSYELVWEQRLGEHWNGSASLFLNDIKGLIAYQQDPSDSRFYFDNVDSVQAKGIETEIEGHWAGGLSGRASYTYTHARDAKSGLRVSNSPEHLAKLGLSLPLWQNKLFASAEVQGMSVRETVRGGSVRGFWLANATLFSRELVKGLEISASVYNFLDQRYSDPVTSDFTQDAIPQDGRTFRVKLAWRF